MKKLWIGGIGILTVIAVVLGLVIAVSARNEKNEARQREAERTQAELALYKEQIVKLEEQVNELKETQYQSTVDYENKILELEKQIDGMEDTLVVSPQVTTNMIFTYTVSDGGATITGYRGEGSELYIPAEIDGYKVVAIGREAFRGSGFYKAVIPDGVQKIDWFAFADCAQLTSIHIPSTVSRIEYGAFDQANKVTVFCQSNSYAHRYAKSYGIKLQLN